MWTNRTRTRIIFYLFPGLAALGFLVYAIATLYSGGGGESNREKVLAADFSLSELSEKSAINIDVTNSSGHYVLLPPLPKVDPSVSGPLYEWSIGVSNGKGDSVPVAKGRIEELFRSLDETKVSLIAGTGGHAFNRHRVHLKANDATVLFDPGTGYSSGSNDHFILLIGKTAGGKDRFFLRPVDSIEVFEATGDLRDIFTRPADDWRDRTIFSSNPGEVRQIAVTVNQPIKMSSRLFRDSQGWKIQDRRGTRVARPSASRLVEELYSWEADGLAALSEIKAVRTRPTVATMILSGKQSRIGILTFRSAKNGGYYVTRRSAGLMQDDPEVWFIEAGTVLKMLGRV